jgi:TolB-like protein
MRPFLAELRRRNVYKVGVAYAVVAWIALQAASFLLPSFGAPAWVFRVLVLLVLVGFVLALAFSWAFELTPEGLKRTHEVPHEHSITHVTGRKLDFAIIGLLIVALGISVYLNLRKAPQGQRSASIAVLPFTSRSVDPAHAMFADGIHDELLTSLANIGSLKVISRTSVMEYRDTTKNLRQIGKELSVAPSSRGPVQRAGDNVRINVQLHRRGDRRAPLGEHVRPPTEHRQSVCHPDRDRDDHRGEAQGNADAGRKATHHEGADGEPPGLQPVSRGPAESVPAQAGNPSTRPRAFRAVRSLSTPKFAKAYSGTERYAEHSVCQL